jgi:hypothetical protein
VTKFIAYPDNSQPGRSRFLLAVVTCCAKIRRGFSGPPLQFLVECEDREAFAAAAGTGRRPIVTENAPVARPT